jgi:hypothetical protein
MSQYKEGQFPTMIPHLQRITSRIKLLDTNRCNEPEPEP